MPFVTCIIKSANDITLSERRGYLILEHFSLGNCIYFLGFPGGSSVKESAYSAGDLS